MKVVWAAVLGASIFLGACGGDSASDAEPGDEPIVDGHAAPPMGVMPPDNPVSADPTPVDNLPDPGTGPVDAGAALVDTGTAAPTLAANCAARMVEGDATMHFHHIHFNTVDPELDLAFFETAFGAAPVDFCTDPTSGGVTRATKTERGYFLYSKVDTAPDPALNTYLEHVGWIHPDPAAELQRLVGLGVMLEQEGRAQCAEAAAGTAPCGVIPYWFYLEAPSGARIEIALGPGPAMMGFGHVHIIQGEDMTFYATVSDDAYMGGAIDMVNHTDVSLTEDRLANETVTETRGKPIDHIAYSTTDLAAAKTRLEGLGITIEEDISFKPEYGFDSFFVKSPKGIWVEIVADSPFAP